MYFALCPEIVLPPKPTTVPFIVYIGKVILSINREYKPFCPVSIIPNSLASAKFKKLVFKKLIVSFELLAKPTSNFSIEKSDISELL